MTLSALASVALLTSGTPAGAAPVSNSELESAPVPGRMCRHPKGHLESGKRDFGLSGSEWIEATAVGRAGGRTVAALSIGCTAGGVTWPETIVFYRRDGRGQLQIAAKTYLGQFRAAEHADVRSMSVSGRRLHVTWTSYEGCCFERQRFSADMRVRGTKVVVTSLTKGRITHPYPS